MRRSRPRATLAGEDAAIRLCEGVDGGTGRVHRGRRRRRRRRSWSAPHFSLDVLQDWKRQRLLDRDAYVVQSHESTIRGTALAAHETSEGSVLVAPLFMRDEFRGMMVVATPRGDARLGRRQPPSALVAGRARARERGAHRGSAAATERGTIRVAGQELIRRGHGHRPDHRGPLREPVGVSPARSRPRRSSRARASSTWSIMTTRHACCRSSRRPATVRATRHCWSSAFGTVTGRTWPPRPCGRACCTTPT